MLANLLQEFEVAVRIFTLRLSSFKDQKATRLIQRREVSTPTTANSFRESGNIGESQIGDILTIRSSEQCVTPEDADLRVRRPPVLRNLRIEQSEGVSSKFGKEHF